MGLSRGDRIVEATFNSEVTTNQGSAVLMLFHLLWMFLSLDLKKKTSIFIYYSLSRYFSVDESCSEWSSRKVPVLAHFTIHMVEIIQLYTDQPHTWLGFRHHPSSSVFQPYVWLDTISNSLNF